VFVCVCVYDMMPVDAEAVFGPLAAHD
jgi:hypothetical protein